METVQIVQNTIRMPRKTHEVLMNKAGEKGISFNSLVCIILQKYLDSER